MRPDARPPQVDGAGWMRPRSVRATMLETVPALAQPTPVVSEEERILRKAA
jgi:hypothetical protein